MTSMNELIKSLTNAQSLSHQIRTAKIFSVNHWSAIAANMTAKNKISATIYHALEDKNKTDEF